MTGRTAGFISASLCAIGCCVPVPPAAAVPDGAPVSVGVGEPTPPAREAPTLALGRSVNVESWFRWDYASLYGDGRYDPGLARALGLDLLP
jgi:hypothetical protein